MAKTVTVQDVLGEPLEGEEQEQLFRWAEMQAGAYPELEHMYHVPNGGKRNRIEAAKLKRQGVKAGVPDIHLPAPRYGYHGLYIELKRQHEGKVSKDQAEWIEYLAHEGYVAAVCHGWYGAAQLIMRYLRGGMRRAVPTP